METAGKHVDRESQVFEQLKGEKKHFCPDWDYMAIDETCPEFEACICKFCDYPNCKCPVSFPEGHKPSVATECPRE